MLLGKWVEERGRCPQSGKPTESLSVGSSEETGDEPRCLSSLVADLEYWQLGTLLIWGKTKSLASFFEFPMAFLIILIFKRRESQSSTMSAHHVYHYFAELAWLWHSAVYQDENETCEQLPSRQHRHQPCQSQLSHQTTGKWSLGLIYR